MRKLISRCPLVLFLASAAAAQPADSPYGRWLDEDVVYIIEPAEKAAFERLNSDPEREKFIEQFWQRRDPTPATSDNEFKVEHYRRIAYSNQRFGWQGGPGWKSDRGLTYILYGPPDEIESHTGREAWRYRHIDGVGDGVIFEFVEREKGDYRLRGPAPRIV